MLTLTTTSKLIQLPANKIKLINQEVLRGKDKDRISLTIALKGRYTCCPHCRRKTKKRYDNSLYRQNNVKHVIAFKYDIVLNLIKRRFYCKKCKKDFVEQPSFLSYKVEEDKKIRSKGHTKYFEEYILFEWHQLSVAEIARRCRVSEFRIWSIIGEIDTEKLMKKGIQIMLDHDGPLFLGIDEHSFSGRDMVLVITEHSTKKVVAVLKNTSKETLKNWLNNLPPKVMVKIQGLTIDMTDRYKNTVLKTLGAQIVCIVDKFHIIKLANNMINEVRQINNWMIQAGYYGKDMIDMKAKKALKKRKIGESADEAFLKYRNKPPDALKKIKGFREYRPDTPDYRPVTIEHYLDQKYASLFLAGEERLTNKQKHRLNQILTEFDPKGYMKEAYDTKETIRDMLKDKDKAKLDELMSRIKDSEHFKVQEFYRTLKRWYDSILNYFEYGLTNARLEGKNTKAKLLKRISYGYNTKKNYMKKLMFVC